MTTSVAAAGEVIGRGRASRPHRGLPLRSRHDRGTDRPEGRAERRVARAAPGPAGAPAGLRRLARRRAGVRLAAARLLGRRPGRAPAAERRHPGAQGRGAAVRPARRAGARGGAQARRHLGRDAHSPRPQRTDGCARTAELPAGARGIIFQLCESLGVLPRRPIEDQLAQLGEEDRKALARLGVRVGVYSLYFPSMLKPVPIRLRAGLWMIARNRETIPPLPAEGRTSMDLPQGARARLLRHHRLPAAGRPRHPRRHGRAPGGDGAPRRARKPRGRAPRAADSSSRRSPTPTPTPTAAAHRRSAAPSTDEISEWAIVAAAFGESEPAPAEPVAEAPAVEAACRADAGRGRERAGRRPKPSRAEPSTAEEADGREPTAEETDGRRDDARRGRSREEPVGESHGRSGRRRRAPSRRGEGGSAKPAGPRPLPPGWFRATPQMMSLVGCSEPEMANVLRGAGLSRPSADGRDTARSTPSRSSRASCASARSSASASACSRARAARAAPPRAAASGRTSGSSSPTRPRPDARQGSSAAPRWSAPEGHAPARTGATMVRRARRSTQDGPAARRSPRVRGRRAATAAGRRCRLYATTEKKGDAAADSPFAKLLELKLGGKK